MVRDGTFHIIWNSLKTSIYYSQSINFSLCFYTFPEDSCLSHFSRKFQLHSYEFEMEEEWKNKNYVWPTCTYTESKSKNHFVDQNIALVVDWVVGIVIKRNLDWLAWASIYFSFNNPHLVRECDFKLQFYEYFSKKQFPHGVTTVESHVIIQFWSNFILLKDYRVLCSETRIIQKFRSEA